MGFFEDFFDGENDEILFFIIVFLFLFSANLFERGHNEEVRNEGENDPMLFFIILFLLLLFNISWVNTSDKIT